MRRRRLISGAILALLGAPNWPGAADAMASDHVPHRFQHKLDESGPYVRLLVADDGRGFDPATVSDGGASAFTECTSGRV